MVEYAILLTIRYGKLNKVSMKETTAYKTKREKKCRKIDRYALIFFMLIDFATMSTYFYIYY